MRYLTPAFAIGALRRRREIEQFLGPVDGADGARGIRWVAIWPTGGKYNISVFDMLDVDDEHRRDLATLPPLDPDGDEDGTGRHVAFGDEPDEAIALARELTGASPSRWVNHGVAGEEYADYVRERRARRHD